MASIHAPLSSFKIWISSSSNNDILSAILLCSWLFI
jgi:hypothetical protein